MMGNLQVKVRGELLEETCLGQEWPSVPAVLSCWLRAAQASVAVTVAFSHSGSESVAAGDLLSAAPTAGCPERRGTVVTTGEL